MRLLNPIGTFVLLIASCHCQINRQNPSSPDPTIGATPENLEAVSQSVTNLAQKISLAIANPKSKTEIFSPVSIAGALSLLLLGSGGETREELMNVMGFKNSRLTFTDIHKSFGRLFQDLVSNEAQNVSIPWRENDKCNNYDYDDEDDYQPKETHRGKRDTDSHFISVANGVFVDNSLPLNSRYENLTKELYAGEIEKMALYRDPVGASNRINNWVQQATRNKIRQIVSPEQVSNAPMVLASALYFKAKWETMFIEPDTRPRPFYLNGRNAAPIDIDTMATSGCFPFYEDKQHDAKIVGLPYQEGKSTMYIIVPNQSDRQKLRNLQNVVSLQDWDNRIDQMVVKTGTFLMPKMKIENALGLRDVLNHLGLREVFNPERSDLTAITKDDPILTDMNLQRPEKQPSRQPNPVTQLPTATPNNYPTTTRRTKSKTTLSTTRATQPSKHVSIPMPLNFTECEMINNCFYKAKQCFCAPTYQSYELTGCRLKPFIVRHDCPPEATLLSVGYPINVQVCPVESYVKSQQCTRSCYSLRESECFCCRNGNQPTNQFTQPIPTATYSPINVPANYPEYQTGNQQNYQYGNQQSYQHGNQQSYQHGNQQSYQHGNQQSHQHGNQQSHQHGNQQHNQYGTQQSYQNGNQQHIQYGNQPNIVNQPVTESNVSPTIEVANRFNADPTDALPAQPTVYRDCKTYTQCNYFGYDCRLMKRCTTINLAYRRKRQTATPQQQPKLFVGDVLHKVSLDINEQGTEGGAVTAIVIDRISSSFNLRVDGPFLIYLRNDVTKLPLFYGAVFDPRS